MITIRVFAQLRTRIGHNEIQMPLASNDKIEDILNRFVEKYPQIKDYLFNESGKIHSFFSILVNDRNIRLEDGIDTKLHEGDILVILPPIGGG